MRSTGPRRCVPQGLQELGWAEGRTGGGHRDRETCLAIPTFGGSDPRLFFDIEAVLFDVWDNRQLGGLKNYARQLRPLLEDGFQLSAAQVNRARDIIDAILKVSSFDELYNLLGFKYLVEGSGSLSEFASGSFQLVVSGGVLKYIKWEAVPGLIAETRRILKPEGWAVHSIDTADHLEHYDRSVSPKLYLTSSEWAWRHLWENEVQLH